LLRVNNLVAKVHKNPNPLLNNAYLTTLNLDNFKMIGAMGLKVPLNCITSVKRIHEILPSGSKVVS
jgi:hypothetical protein